MPEITVGYVLKEHKIKVLGMPDFDGKTYGEYRFKTVKINPIIPLDEQKKCDVIIHKIHDVLIDELGMRSRDKVYEEIKKFFKQARDMNVRILDIWDYVETLNSRISCSRLMEKIEFTCEGISVAGPPTFLLDKLGTSDEIFDKFNDSNIKFPILAKPTGGIMANSRYEMSIHFSNTSKNFGDISSQLSNSVPCAIQQYYKHGGILYKLYIVGDYYEVDVRPSIIDMDNNQDPVYFKSNFISRNQNSCQITSKLDIKKISKDRVRGLNQKVIAELIDRMRAIVDLQLVGLDIIIESGTNNYFVVDINYFPGFKGIQEPRRKLAELFIKAYNSSCDY